LKPGRREHIPTAWHCLEGIGGFRLPTRLGIQLPAKHQRERQTESEVYYYIGYPNLNPTYLLPVRRSRPFPAWKRHFRPTILLAIRTRSSRPPTRPWEITRILSLSLTHPGITPKETTPLWSNACIGDLGYSRMASHCYQCNLLRKEAHHYEPHRSVSDYKRKLVERIILALHPT
jgi:hypothetical protein